MIEPLLRARVTTSTSRHPVVIGVLTVAIILLSVIAARSAGITLGSIRWGPMLGALMVSFASPALAALEYRMGVSLAGGQTDWPTAVQVSLYGSIANFLPLPAGFAVRLKAMTEQGAGTKRALAASVVIALSWLSISLLCLGAALNDNARVLALIGAGLLAFLTGALYQYGGFPWKLLSPLVLLEIMFVVSAAIRFFLVLTGLGVTVDPVQALALSASGPIASAIGIIPGALGILEAISAAIAALVGLTAGSGVVASVVLRVLTAIGILAWLPMTRLGTPNSVPPRD